MKRLPLIALCVLLLHAGEETIELKAGEQLSFKQEGVTKLAVGDPAVASVAVVSEGEFLVTGVGPGETSLIIWTKSGSRQARILVRKEGRAEEVRAFLAEIGLGSKVKLKEVGGKTILFGTLDTVEEESKLRRLGEAFPEINLLVDVKPEAYAKIASAIQEQLASQGYKEVKIWAVGKTVFVEGSVSEEADIRKIMTMARAIYEGAVWLQETPKAQE